MDIFLGLINFLLFMILIFGIIILMASVFNAINPSPVDYNKNIDGEPK
jgi:hypothetical protein